MKKLFTLFLVLASSVGTIFAENVQIGDLYYNLDATNQTAEVIPGNYGGYSGSIIIPESVVYNAITYNVTSIGQNAFVFCTGLTSIEIPNSVTSIGSSAFCDCTSLTSITLSANVTNIGEDAFGYCSSLASIDVDINNDNYCSINGILFNKSQTTLIQYPANKSGSTYSIPNSVARIGYGAFSGCTSLTYIDIPNSVTSIGNEAFNGCSGLTSVTIPRNITNIESFTFVYCTGLVSITWNAIHCSDFSSTSTPFFCPFPGFDVRAQISSFVFGDEVEHIPAYLCSGMSQISSITIPNSVTSIGDDTFYECTGLTSIEIPNSVTSIGSSAFSGCMGITSVEWNAINCNCCNFGNQVTSFTFGEEVEVIPASVCSGMSLLKDIVIPNSVTSIGNNAFSGCTGFTSMTIPSSVTSIGESAFYGCTGLTFVTIPNSVTSIGELAFYGCTSLTSVTAPTCIFEVKEGNWKDYTHSLQSVTFTSGELTYNVLGLLARSYKTLSYLDISAVLNAELDDEAFKGFYNLQTLVLPAGLTRIGYMAVADCKNLQSINIPASVTEISQSAFENCRSLTTITFGGQASSAPGHHNAPASSNSQLQTIGNWAFYNCHELQNLTIPEGVTYIGDGAFYGCTYLEDLTLPASVQTIGDNTFALCAKLQKIVVNAPVPPSIQAKTFFDVKRQIPVYVPDEAVSAYENDSYWGEFDIQGISHMLQGIDQITNDQSPITNKVMMDGQILILRNDQTYTLTGQEVR